MLRVLYGMQLQPVAIDAMLQDWQHLAMGQPGVLYVFLPPSLYSVLPHKLLTSACKLVLVVFVWFQHAMPKHLRRQFRSCVLQHHYLGPAQQCLRAGPLWNPALELPAGGLEAMLLDCSRA